MIGLVLVVNTDTVRVMIESLGLKGDTGFRFQGLIGTVLLVGGLSVTVWAATRLANDSRVMLTQHGFIGRFGKHRTNVPREASEPPIVPVPERS